MVPKFVIRTQFTGNIIWRCPRCRYRNQTPMSIGDYTLICDHCKMVFDHTFQFWAVNRGRSISPPDIVIPVQKPLEYPWPDTLAPPRIQYSGTLWFTCLYCGKCTPKRLVPGKWNVECTRIGYREDANCGRNVAVGGQLVNKLQGDPVQKAGEAMQLGIFRGVWKSRKAIHTLVFKQ